MNKKSKIVLLGTGTPNADPARSGPSIAIVVENSPYIIDVGPGVIRRASAAYQAGVDALDITKLNLVFVTHLHSDHTLGYADMIFSPWVLERDNPLQVFGPPGIKNMTDHLLSAYQLDIHERINGLEPANHYGYQVNVSEISPGKIYEDQLVSVEAFRVNHGSLIAFGFKFYLPDRLIILSGDTAPFECMADTYKGCDVLIHEVYSAEGLKNHPPEWQRYHSSVHTSTVELAKIATLVNPGLLILYHQLFHGMTEKELLNEIQQSYKGKIVSGKDLEVY